MNKLKRRGMIMIAAGGLFAAVMCVGLFRSFSAVTDGSTATELAAAVAPWNLAASIGAVIFFTGLVVWIVGWIRGRREQRVATS